MSVSNELAISAAQPPRRQTLMSIRTMLPRSLRTALTFAVLAFAACSAKDDEGPPLGSGSAPQSEGSDAGAAGAATPPSEGAGGADGEAPPDDGTGNKRPVGEPNEPDEEPGPKGGTGPGTGEEPVGGDASRPKPEPEPEPVSEAFLRGEALVEKNGCVTCHQVNFAGFTIFPNITPDETTGIGAWTDAQIVAAIRDGVDVDGSNLCSMMTRYPFTDEEAGDIVAFLRGIPAVTNAVTSVCPGHGQ
jgi:hypothetical protein